MEKKREVKVPHAFVILLFAVAAVSILTYLVSAGAYDYVIAF